MVNVIPFGSGFFFSCRFYFSGGVCSVCVSMKVYVFVFWFETAQVNMKSVFYVFGMSLSLFHPHLSVPVL